MKQTNDGAHSNIDTMNRELEDLKMKINEYQISEERLKAVPYAPLCIDCAN